MSLNILLISDTIIKERTSIHGNIDSKLLYPDIKVAQDMYILPLLGSALYNKLQTIISNGTITTDPLNIDYKLLLDKYVIDTLIYYTLSELPTTISYQFWNKGVSRKIGNDSENPSMSELIDLSNKYKNRAEFYAERMKSYLLAFAGTKYLEYLNPGNNAETMNPTHRAFTSPIYLGGNDYGCSNDSWFPQQPYKP